MANQEHLDLLKQGMGTWNQWRKENPDIQTDLSGADLSEVDLSTVSIKGTNIQYNKSAYLRRIDLRGVDLGSVDFHEGDLSDDEVFEVFYKRVDLSGVNLRSAFLCWADLHGANLRGADLSEADLTEANLTEADLSQAVLFNATLSQAILFEADLTDTDLTGAVLRRTNLNRAILTRANLSRTDLNSAILTQAYFSETNLSQAELFLTSFGDASLDQVKGLDTVKHKGRSDIGINTIYYSQGLIPRSFLQGAGIPDSFITYAGSLLESDVPIDFYSCFISYSSKDQAFAKRLYTDLQSHGVRCWFAPEDLKIGDRIRPRIDESIRLHDKLLLVLSQYSVASQWVEQEVERALARERKENKVILFPIRLDKTVMDMEEGWPALIRNTRNIGDFTRWKRHDAYQKAFDHLLHDLKAES